ncbi:MAG: preprotein translocase subunit SecE [Bdellovibrionaceae bacterium]|nr:preprotein translocase subunit SecE [Pseudobdellovibrionaceae bacterium]
MDKGTINKTVTFSFVAAAFLIWWVSGVLLETAAGAFPWLAQLKAYRIAGVEILQTILPMALGVLTFILLQFNAKRRAFGQEVVVETSKVVWPSAKDVQGSTIVVVIMILISSVVLFTLDWASNEVIRTILGL